MNRALALAAAAVLAVTLGGAARAAPLPPPGPPPDPARGEPYDGRSRPAEAASRRLALAFPRALLVPPRLVLRLVRFPALAAIRAFGNPAPVAYWVKGTRRAGISPVAFLDLGLERFPSIGARVWALDLFGPGIATTSLQVATGGPRFVDARLIVDPNVALPLGAGGEVIVARRADAPFYGIGDGAPAEGDGGDLRRTVEVTSVDASGRLVLRSGGGAGRWRLSASGGGGLRRFGVSDYDTPADPAATPGMQDEPTFVRGGLALERIALYDRSRRRPGVDLEFSLEQTAGVAAGDESRYLTASAQAAVGLPVGDAHTVVLRLFAADQESWGDDPVPFTDRLSLGGSRLLRGFAPNRFRGGSALVASADYRWPIAAWLDGFAFLEAGGAFAERLEGFEAEELRTSFGVGIRMFRGDRFLIRALVGWGVGDGPRISITFDPGP